jgi:hypothetical protein
MQIPYGRSNFEEIRRRGYFYVDKTPFLPLLESAQVGYPLFLRPRRFGKSTLLSMLEHYYDLARKDQFDDLFGGLWVHEHPTAERNSYLVLVLDFSGVATDGGHDALRRSFLDAVKVRVRDFCLAYRALGPTLDWLESRLDGYDSPDALVGDVLHAARSTGRKLYLLIDEYDSFANRLLAGGEDKVYDDAVVKRTGFARTFYAQLKTGTQSGSLGRIFITGVTPLMLDDLASGFNIVTPITTSPHMNALAGFTHADVERALDAFLAERPELAGLPELGDRRRLLDVLEAHYDGYRFSADAPSRVFNPDMVLYFLRELADRGKYPDDMLDRNVRTEYRHLQRIGAASGAGADERRALFETILGEGHIRSELVRQFGIRELSSHAPFVSLLFALGMLTLRDVPRDAIGYDLEIPNRVIRELQWEHLALMLKEQAHVAIHLEELQAALGVMVTDGDIAPFLAVFHEQVLKALSVRDTRQLGEKTIKLLLMMYASLGHAFHPLTEKEFAQGYCDLFLGASPTMPSARYSWLLELKYVKAGSKPATIEAVFAEAEEQVARYASDEALLPLLVGRRELKAGMLVFVGTKKVLFRPWPAPARPPARKAGAKKGAKRAASRRR